MKPQFNKSVFAASMVTGVFFMVCPTEEPIMSLFMTFLAFAAACSEIVHYTKQVKKYNSEVEKVDKRD